MRSITTVLEREREVGEFPVKMLAVPKTELAGIGRRA